MELLGPNIWAITPLVLSTGLNKPAHTTARAHIMDLSTVHYTVLSTGARTGCPRGSTGAPMDSPRLVSHPLEPPTHLRTTLQVQTSPTSLASTCVEGVGTGRTQDTPKATQVMTGATRTRAPQDQAIQTPGALTLSQGPQTGGGTIGWAHQGHPGTRGLPLTLLSRATHRTHMGRL